jgi:PIN domain nuclease of toxin-antitoxin system
VKLLLDTHVFLWYISADPRLPAPFNNAIMAAGNVVHLSVASLWECEI